MRGPTRAGKKAKLYIVPVQCPSLEWARCLFSGVLYVQLRILAIDAGGSPMTAPDVTPKMTQNAIAAVVDPASDQRTMHSSEEMI
jgi:hypothetical protein